MSVFSPHLGQVCDARILVANEELDVAVLEVPWKGHPALPLADANAPAAAPSARVISFQGVIQHLRDGTESSGESNTAGRDETLFQPDEDQVRSARS